MERSVSFKFRCPWMLQRSPHVFFLFRCFLISVKPLTTGITKNKTTPKFCKITVCETRLSTESNSSSNDRKETKLGRGKYGKRITEEAVLQGKSLLFSHVHNSYPVLLFCREVIFPPLDFQFLFLTQVLHGQRLIPFRTKPRGNRCQAVRPSRLLKAFVFIRQMSRLFQL